MHTVIFPYFSEPEVLRYERILTHIARLGPQTVPYEILLASSPATSPNARLYEAASRVAPTRLFECPTQVFGYPAGCSAMFWDCMWHVANDADSAQDFVMWFESDMCPVKPDWLDRLSADWEACGDVFAMGFVIPDIDRERRNKFAPWRPPRRKRWVNLHVNGGACYRRDLIRHVGVEHRAGIFDIEIGKMLKSDGGYADTPAIVLTTKERLAAELRNEKTAVVHGYLQDKDDFLDTCFADLLGESPQSTLPAPPNELSEQRPAHPSTALFNAVLKSKEAEPRTLQIVNRRTQEDVQKPSAKVSIDQKQVQPIRLWRRAA